jgi:hypothetical protein
MATNSQLLQRPTDNNLYKLAAVLFPLVVLVGYFKTYYFSAFFDGPSVANKLVHFHGLVMSLWVIYFAAQIALVRTKNLKLHMTMGMVGVALAVLVVIVGMATAYDAQLVRGSAPPGVNPHAFFFLPAGDMALFVLFFAAAIYYRKRPAAHKPLMLLTAINFMPAALFRVSPVPPELTLFWAFGIPAVIAMACFGWHTLKTGKFNRVYAAGVAVVVAMVPLRFVVPDSGPWLRFVALLAG